MTIYVGPYEKLIACFIDQHNYLIGYLQVYMDYMNNALAIKPGAQWLQAGTYLYS